MREAVGIAVLLVVLVVVLLAMRAGWRGRAQRSATLVPVLPAVPPADRLGAARTGAVDAVYVSTTVAGDWLDRVVAHDLGVRSIASVRLHDAGLVVTRTGARDLFVPAAALREARLEPGIAGKVVGGQGLVVVGWEAVAARGAMLRGDDPAAATLLETGLRLRHAADREALVAAVRTLLDPGAPREGAADGSPHVTTPERPKEQHA